MTTTSSELPATPRKYSQFQFSMRSVLVLVTLASVVCGGLAGWQLRRQREQARLQAYQTEWSKLGYGVNQDASTDDEVTFLCVMHDPKRDAWPPRLERLPNLNSFMFRADQISEISPEMLLQLPNLQELQIGGDKLKAIPPEIGALNTVNTLGISGLNLTKLPAEIGNLSVLLNLFLHDTQLTTLPPEIGNINSLRSLTADSNQLTTLPSEIGKLANLVQLTLDRNKLVELPAEVGKLTNLQQLNLEHNQLAQLPTEIGQLRSLTRLDLSYNPITDTALEELTQLVGLRHLHVEGTNVTAEGVAVLQAMLPNCRISSDY